MTTDPDKLTESELEALAREFGKPVPEKLKQGVLDEIQRKKEKGRASDLEKHLDEMESDKESPDLER